MEHLNPTLPEKQSQAEQAAPAKVSAVVKYHPTLDTKGLTAAEYAYDSMTMHQEQYKGKPPPALLKWVGDAALAVLPMNRMFCAIGLTAGLMLAGNTAKIMTGYGLDGKAVEFDKVPTFMRKLHKIVPNYEGPSALGARNQWIKYGQWAAYSFGGFLGIKAGTSFAYKNVGEKNKNPHYVEDYLARVSMHQGDSWSWLAAASGIFGSSSGLFALPIPGLNYAMGLAGRTASMQDRNFMIKGLNGMMSGATTTSYLRLREGMHYMCHYAVGNPAETPAQLEFLAYTLLGPIFKDQLKPEHIKEFVETVHEVRDQFWQPGGIPQERRKEAVKTMKEVFTGAGLETLLINMGLNPGTIVFDKLNGAVGKIGNTLGANGKVHREQADYLKALEGRLETYVKEGIVSEERAQWVRDGIDAAQHGRPLPAEPAAKIVPSQEVLTPDLVPVAEQPLANDNSPAGERRAFNKSRVEIGAMSREDPVDKLVQAASKSDEDWAALALKQKQNRRSPAFVVE